MIRSSKSLLAAGLCAALLTACGGGGTQSGVVPSSTTQPNPNSGSPTASGLGTFQYGQSLLSQMAYLGPATAGNLSLTVGVRMRNARRLVEYAAQANDPTSGTYRQWLTPQQIADKFGATTTDYQAAASYFTSYGLKVGTWPQREALSVSGSIGQFTRAFGTKFGVYQFLGHKIIAPAGAPHFASSIPVTGSSPMMTASTNQSYLIHGNNAKFLGYAPQQVATGFDYSGAWASGINGSGVNVGIIGTGPILNARGGDDDTAAYSAYWHAPMAKITQIAAAPQPASSPNGGSGTGSVDANPSGLAMPPPVTAPCQQPQFPTPPNYTTCNPEDVEAQLDTESVASLAPGSNVLFYLAYNAGECVNPTTGSIDLPTSTGACPAGDELYPLEGLQIVDDEYQQAIADNKADILSMSFGEPENLALAFGYISTDPNNPGIGQVEFSSMAAEGTALFVSSGDNGAWECFDPNTGNPLGTPCASHPAVDSNVVAVGGVNIPLDENGNLVGEIAAWADNTTNGGTGAFGNNVGSGGGISAVFTAPKWQVATLGATMREEPDMSLDADPLTGQSIMTYAAFGGAVGAEGGTSMSAPEAAAQWALVLQACKASASCSKLAPNGRLGNPNAFFYAIYGTSTLAKGTYGAPSFTPGLDYAHVFTDVIYGSNRAVPAPPGTGQSTPPPTSGYNSGPGYDEVTGIGAPSTGHLIQAITGTKVP